MIRVALVADSPVVHAGLVALLASDPGIDIVESSAVLDPVVIGESLRVSVPDPELIVWAPAHFDPADGAGALDAGEFGAGPFTPALVVLLPIVDVATVGEAIRAGARAVLPADADRDELVAAIHAVAAGLGAVPRTLLPDLVGAQNATREHAGAESDAASPALTQREREVLALLVDGRANKVIAARLGISEHTVKTHIASLYEKLGTRNRAEAVVAAARRGLVIL
jgi:DNA-binding NarL/FixJ family response regulator